MKDPRCPCDTEGQKLSWRGQRLRSPGEVGERLPVDYLTSNPAQSNHVLCKTALR